MHELTIPATVENIEKVTDFVNEKLEEIDCPMKAQMQIDVAIDDFSETSRIMPTIPKPALQRYGSRSRKHPFPSLSPLSITAFPMIR